MTQVFLSHATADDALVRRLQRALALQGIDLWIDSREICGGDPLWPVVQQAIERADAYAVLVTPKALQSQWVGDELALGLTAQQTRGRERYPVIPLAVDRTRLGVLNRLFREPPAYIALADAPGGIEAALDRLLAALGRRLLADPAPTPQPTAEPIEDLVLELTALRFHQTPEGIRRPSARARLVHQPALSPQGPNRREVASEHSWRLIAPLGPIEADDLRWYLEDYAVWPGTQFQARARRVEESLADWGQALYQAAQWALHEDSFRGHCFGAGELRLQDWFVPVLYQERDDPQLFTQIPAARTSADLKIARQTRLGAVPGPPESGFIGRSRDLLALERLLQPAQPKVPQERRWALIRGQGGEGKTALAGELGRWLVRSQQIERLAFCSVETQGQAAAVLDAIGRQLVGPHYSVAALGAPPGAPHPSAASDAAIQPVERALTEHPTLLIIDNLESLLLPPTSPPRPPPP